MPFQSLIRWLLPKDDKFFSLLEEHAGVLAEAAEIMQRLLLPSAHPAEILEEVHKLEHRGDYLVREVMLALDETFVTPIDREDIHSLATSLDNVLDYMYKAAQSFVAFEVQELTAAMRDMLQILAESTRVLKDTLPHIRSHHLEKFAPARLQIVGMEKRGDGIYQSEMAALFKNRSVDAKELLRQQAVLDSLEAALNSCQDAADVLENVAIKHA
jgi:predicted phosphate transport protein (TIGR00153 family)